MRHLNQKVVVEHLRDANQQLHIYIFAFEYFIGIAHIAVYLGGKPCHLAALPVQLVPYQPANVNVYVFLYAHYKTVNFCFCLRFAKTLNTNKKAHGYTASISTFLRIKVEIWRFQTSKEKRKRFYVNKMLSTIG